MILLIDNYDSFTYNLYQYIGELYKDIQVVRDDEITISDIETMQPQALIFSPGPGYPKDAGITLEAIHHFSGKLPMLGVCLGHQSICEAFGGTIVQAETLMHGKSSKITLDLSCPIFAGLSQTIEGGRYHSLIAQASDFPEVLKVTAHDEDGQIMALAHKEFPIYGLQFHPESMLTPEGKRMLANFLNLVPGVQVPVPAAKAEAPKTALCQYIAKVVDGNNMTETEAAGAMDVIMSGNATNAQIASLLTAMRIKGETTEEITGFAKGMREKANHIEGCENTIDIVGTGGDLANSFNISTTASFIIAAAGAPVAKHGNRSVSSKSGAADVLEKLGVKVQSTPEQAKASIEKIGISFLFAQSFHGSMRFVGPARKEMGIRTVFNILGPLTNPACADYIVTGVYEKAILPKMAKVFQALGLKGAMVVYGNDRLDEVSISDSTSVVELRNGIIREYEIKPEDFGLPRGNKKEIVGGTAEENAAITLGILDGSIQGTKRNIVLLNAGCALYTYGMTDNIQAGIDLAAQQIDNGNALKKLHELAAFTHADNAQ
ncbi:MAG: bifunctional anthranilate synthase component II/anthranilate phosphoribosyltransferase [Ruminococcus sp.]|nr:bifunctional anthranilate synthase component II/anthranilate phosphoribosyltransferase [Ruminococcus sp.]